MTGKEKYERAFAGKPLYHDGTQRPTWKELSEIAQWTWDKLAPSSTPPELVIFAN